MKDYIVLDLETPNRYNNSMCSIGMVVVEKGEITDEIYTLINPEQPFDDFNISFTGIGPEDVKGYPTFVQFWQEYNKLLTDNIIVGQNITFDLNVISKALTRYNMPLPVFNYYCTLSSSKRNLNLPDNSLSYIVKNVLNTTYNAHNAMADAQMTYELFNVLSNYEQRRYFIQTYYYRPNCKRDFDRNLDIEYNYLYGLLERFNYITAITDNHYKLIEKWYESNKITNNHPLIENTLLKVRYILENRNLNSKQMKNIIRSQKAILRSPKYKAPILKLEILRGILDSLRYEETITKQDEKFLIKWLEKNRVNEKTCKNFTKKLKSEDKIRENMQEYALFLQEYKIQY